MQLLKALFRSYTVLSFTKSRQAPEAVLVGRKHILVRDCNLKVNESYFTAGKTRGL